MNYQYKPTADFCDDPNEKSEVWDENFINYGGLREFSGHVETVSLKETNEILFDVLSENGENKILIVDSGGIYSDAIFGDRLATLAEKNKWIGLIIYGRLRDSKELKNFNLGIKALGTTPKRLLKQGDNVFRGSRGTNLNFKSITIRPSSYLVADDDGIVLLRA